MRQGLAPLILFLWLFAAPPDAFADGKMYALDHIPPTIPYQRALILHKEGTQTLILQSKYALPEGESVVALGWVVPLPAVPELASMPASEAASLFRHLSYSSASSIQPLILGLMGFSALAFLCVVLASRLLGSARSERPLAQYIRKRRSVIIDAALKWTIAICIFCGLLLIGTAGPSDREPVEILKTESVGVYDVRVVRSDKADELIAWLNENQFRFGPEDETAFQVCVAKGWVFVVARLNPEADQSPENLVAEGLAAPLIMRFPSPNPIYPLALTATGGHDTEVLIYLASDAPMDCGGRLKLRYAGWMEPGAVALFNLEDLDPADFFDGQDREFRFLAKFGGRMTAKQMAEDLEFRPNPKIKEYRETKFTW